MGAESSSPQNMGWRVLDIIPGSPSANKGFVPYFDYIVGVNGVRLNTSSEMLGDVMLAFEDKQVELTVFNYKTRIKRGVMVNPSSQWGGQGVLGLIVIPGDFTKANQQCMRILKVSPNSPAEKAGLQENDDYLLGTPVEAFTDITKFSNIIQDFVDRPLPVWVYNSAETTLRKIVLEPSSTWEGQGVLGCEVGGGLLHNIPSLKEGQEDIKILTPPDDLNDLNDSNDIHHGPNGMNGMNGLDDNVYSTAYDDDNNNNNNNNTIDDNIDNDNKSKEMKRNEYNKEHEKLNKTTEMAMQNEVYNQEEQEQEYEYADEIDIH